MVDGMNDSIIDETQWRHSAVEFSKLIPQKVFSQFI